MQKNYSAPSNFKELRRKTALALLACSLAATAAHGQFAFERTEDKLIVREGDRTVLVFNHHDVQPPVAGTPRSGYIHPLHGLDGAILTDDFPADHLHHRGVFFGWPAMTVMGKKVDFWHLRGLRPSFEDLQTIQADEQSAAFESRNIWRLEGGTETVRECLRYSIHASDKTGQAIDVHAAFTNLTDQPVTLSGSPTSAYGGLNLRMDGTRPDVRIATAEGPVTENINAIDPPSPWADHASRPAADQPHSGVAIFQHPGNPDYPARNWTLRPYGFLGAAWPGESSYDIAPGATLDLRYRLFLHRGAAEEARVAETYERYARENR